MDKISVVVQTRLYEDVEQEIQARVIEEFGSVLAREVEKAQPTGDDYWRGLAAAQGMLKAYEQSLDPTAPKGPEPDIKMAVGPGLISPDALLDAELLRMAIELGHDMVRLPGRGFDRMICGNCQAVSTLAVQCPCQSGGAMRAWANAARAQSVARGHVVGQDAFWCERCGELIKNAGGKKCTE